MKLWRWSLDCLGDPKILAMPEQWDTSQGELLTASWTSSRERRTLQPTKLNRVGDLKSVLTSDMEMQSLEFVQRVFDLALIQYFLIMLCGDILLVFYQIKLAWRSECWTKPLDTRRWCLTPLILVLGSPTPLIRAPGRWRQTGIWLGGERNIRREDTRAHYSLRFGGGSCSLRMKSEDEVRGWSPRMKSEDEVQGQDRPFGLSVGRGKGLSSGWPLCFFDLPAFTS